MSVRIVDTSYVNVPATTTPPPEPMKLTSMEAAWVAFPVLQHVLLFVDDGPEMMPPFDAVLESLRSSLATALASFAPLAGQLVHVKDTGDAAISCSCTDGVRFVVAESDADVRRLAGDEEHDLPVLARLVPDVDMQELPTAVLAVQATRFLGGGVAVGLTVHHAVADGRSLWTFVEAWAAACRGETPSTTPTFERGLVNLPDGDEELARRIFQETLARSGAQRPSLAGHNRRTFALDLQDIQRLKQHILRLSQAHDDDAPLARPPSTFAAVTALSWTCFARCGKPFASDDDDALLFFLADVRGRLDPPVDAGYIGVCLTQCLATVPVRELRGARALLAATAAIQQEVRRMSGEPTDRRSHLAPVIGASWDRVMTVSGSPGFRAYEIADFGWGKPRRTEPVWMNHDGQVALMGGRDVHGVQLSVSLLQQAHMAEFKSQFLDLLDRDKSVEMLSLQNSS